MTTSDNQVYLRPDIKFFNAVLSRNIEVVEQYLQQSDILSNLNAEDNGRTVLMYAAERGLVDMVELLVLQGGADPNYISSYRKTALDFAVSRDNNDTKTRLLELGGLSADELLAKSELTVNEALKNKTKEKTFSVSPVFQREQQYLDGTIEIISQQLDGIKNLSNVGVDRWTRRVLQERYKEKSEILTNSLQSPYFGRVDLIQDSNDVVESMYIGKHGVADANDKLRVISWTAPAGALFYTKKTGQFNDSKLGSVNVKLIRNISIIDQKIMDIFDVGEQVFDPLLLSRLQGKAKKQMQDIVETIQEEQDRVIRLQKNNPIVVQGSAGSGKTTVALHRLAYLFHNHQELAPERLLIIGPNRMFMSYIAEVLPGLGLDGVEQVAFDQWAARRLSQVGFRMARINPYQVYENQKLFRWCNWRGSLQCRDAVNSIIEKCILDMAPTTSVFAESGEFSFLVGNIELRKWYFQSYKYDKAWTRREKILKNIKSRFEWYVKQQERKHNNSDGDVPPNILLALNELRQQFDESFLQLQSTWRAINEFELFFQVFSDINQVINILKGWPQDEIVRVCNYVNRQLKSRQYSYEDIPILLYIRSLIVGEIGIIGEDGPTSLKYQYIVVDEAQDLSPFQLWLVNEIVQKGNIMILGDLAQGIHAYRGITSWSMLENLLGMNIDLVTLTVSYRSTIEIIQLANAIIKPWSSGKFDLSQPVLRHGNKPSLYSLEDYTQQLNLIPQLVLQLQSKGLSKIAIITKTEHSQNDIITMLKRNGFQSEIVKKTDQILSESIIIIDVALSKGLEFDAVIVYDVSFNVYLDTDFDRKLLYIAMTRALHEVYLTSTEPSNLLDEITSDLLLIL